MKRSWVAGLAVTALAVFVVAWAAAPVLAAKSLIHAAEAGDTGRLNTLVDFPALRTSLKAEITDTMVARMRDDPRVAEAGLGGLGTILAPMLVSGAVDVLVTPEVVSQMVTTAKAPDPTDRAAAPATDRPRNKIHQAWGYRSLDTFAVTLTDPDRPDEHLALLMDRRGLFSWKLAGVDLQAGG